MIDNQYRKMVGDALQAGGRRFESAIAHHPLTMLNFSALRGLIVTPVDPLPFAKGVGKGGYMWVHLGTFGYILSQIFTRITT